MTKNEPELIPIPFIDPNDSKLVVICNIPFESTGNGKIKSKIQLLVGEKCWF